jgi:4-nitrophenyl phosphatase
MKPFDLHTIKALILDMDGVLWRGPEPIGDLPAIFQHIHERGWKVALATNNATRTAAQYVEHLHSFGVTIEAWQVVNSAMAAASYLKDTHPNGGAVYVIGEEGLSEALAEKGFTFADHHVVAVVAAMDRKLTYDKLRRATPLIRAGAPFIGTNPDKTFPIPEGLAPGAGAILAALETATGIAPLIMGKPSPAMYQVALERLGTSAVETLVVGDRLETDIQGAQEIGCRTALVLSGVTTPEQAKLWQPQPDLIAQNLASVVSK